MTSTLYRQVAEEIVTELRKGCVPWVKPWNESGTLDIARNAATGRPYSGINVLLLWNAAQRSGFSCNSWMTFLQAQRFAGGVRRGSRGSLMVFAREYVPRRERERISSGAIAAEEAERRFHLQTHRVFNLDQLNAPPDMLRPAHASSAERCEKAEAVLGGCGARVVHESGDAFYDIEGDTVVMPQRRQFGRQEDYYATLLHELVHWTGHPERLGRPFGESPFDPVYIQEELVAELGAAFLCSSLGIQPRTRHSDYIAHWLSQIDAEPKTLFRSSSAASQASNYLLASRE